MRNIADIVLKWHAVRSKGAEALNFKPFPALRTMRNIILAAVAALTFSLFAAPVSARADTGFYDISSAQISGEPGSIIRAEEFGAPQGASAWRVLYRSTGLNGRPIAVSGIIVVPDGPAPADGRPIVSWAHATSGIVQGCARSNYANIYAHMYGLPEMLASGAIVAATD